MKVIILENALIRMASLYNPHSPPGIKDIMPKFSVCFKHAERIEWLEKKQGYYWLSSIHRPEIGCFDYDALIRANNIARARNMAPDKIFRGCRADISLYEIETPRGKSNILKSVYFQELAQVERNQNAQI